MPSLLSMTYDQSAEQLLELAAASGAEAAEVFQSQSLSKPIFFEANRLKQLETSQSEGTTPGLFHSQKLRSLNL
ncbi:hypothetical protein [Planktothrix agardhii]|uniref:hypothetical protein n=1 Tax=Planktothrix agardhii TaxID=1160 RepID=UPI003BB4D1FE